MEIKNNYGLESATRKWFFSIARIGREFNPLDWVKCRIEIDMIKRCQETTLKVLLEIGFLKGIVIHSFLCFNSVEFLRWKEIWIKKKTRRECLDRGCRCAVSLYRASQNCVFLSVRYEARLPLVRNLQLYARNCGNLTTML